LETFLEFRNLEDKLANEVVFMEEVKENISKRGLLETIKILKCTGILINQYPGPNKYIKLIQNIDKLFRGFYDNEIELWNYYKNQAEILNNLFQQCYKEEAYLIASSVTREMEIQAFLSMFELILTSILGEKPVPIEFNFQFANSNYSSEAISKEHMFNYISTSAGTILNFLLHYQKKPNKIEWDCLISEEQLKMSAHHFIVYDKINILKDIVDYWKFNECKVKTSGQVINIEPKNKNVYLANDISLKRFETRRQKLNIEIEHLSIGKSAIDNKATELPPQKFISRDERATYYNCKMYFYLESMDQQILNVPFKEWIRAYSVLNLIAKDFINKRELNHDDLSLNLYKVCPRIRRTDLISHLVKYGVKPENLNIIIDNLTFKAKETDLFDTPLIYLTEEEYTLVPSLVAKMDITRVMMCNFLKKKSDMGFKGSGFEKQVIKDLTNEKIKCCGLHAKGVSKETNEEREYQCDVAFLLDNDLYLCECKSYSQPTTHRGFYELIDKKQDTAENQFKEITDFYSENMDIVRRNMNFPESWSPRKIYKIIIVTPALGSREKYKDTYFIDYSAFSTFIQRSKPALFDVNDKVRYEFDFYSVFSGPISSEKMLKFLNSPPQVDMERKRRRRITKQIPFGEYTLVKFDFQTKFDDKISLMDKNLIKFLNKFGKTYFKI